MSTELLGVVLAGGASRRMGVDKALLPVNGRPMVAWVASALQQAVGEVLIVGRTGSVLGWQATPDDAPGPRGPLLGLTTALRHAQPRAVLAVAVDHPLARWETLRQLAALHRPGWAIVPTESGIRQVTCAIYPAGALDAAARELDGGGSLQGLLGQLPVREVPPAEWRAWGEDGRSWFSVDDAGALEEATRRLTAEAGAAGP